MTIEVVDTDGTVIEFPDGTPPGQIASVMRQRDQQRAARQQATQPAAPSGPPEPNQAQQREAGRYALQRHQLRQMTPFGLGNLTVPLTNLLRDPARRQNVARSFKGAVRSAREIPSLNLPQLASDTGEAVSQGVQNLPQTAGAIVQNLPQIARAATYGPFADEEAAQRRLDLARIMGDQAGVEQAAGEANTQTAMAGLNVGAPVLFGANPSALRAGVTAGAIDAPFALSRGEGSLQERLPGALTEIGGVGAFGGGLQATANAVPRILSRPSQTNARAAEFEQAGVRPMLAATRGQGAAPMTMAIAENPIGGNVRRNLQNSADDVAARSREVAAGYGQHGQPENVGEAVQAGVRRFTAPDPAGAPRRNPAATPSREWSFRAKAQALYDDVFARIEGDETGHLQGATGAGVTTDATRTAIERLQQRVQGPASAQAMRSPFIDDMERALRMDQEAGALRFRDLREWRRTVREQQARPALTQTVDNAALQQLEAGLTRDIYESALIIAGESAAQQLRRADQFYRAGQQRIQNVLQPFADRTGRGAYDRIVALAREGGRQNSRSLQSLRNSLRPDEWREVAATVVDDLGRPAPGNAQALEAGAFSLENFVTNYVKLSPEGRRVLFGGAGRQNLMQELDNLARVAGYLKQVRGFTNFSRSGSSAQNIGTLTAALGATGSAVLGNAAPLAALLALGLGTRITGEMLTNPAFVRWLTSAGRTPAAGGVRAHARALAHLAARDPALAPLAVEVTAAAQAQREPASNDNRQGRLPRTSAGSR